MQNPRNDINMGLSSQKISSDLCKTASQSFYYEYSKFYNIFKIRNAGKFRRTTYIIHP